MSSNPKILSGVNTSNLKQVSNNAFKVVKSQVNDLAKKSVNSGVNAVKPHLEKAISDVKSQARKEANQLAKQAEQHAKNEANKVLTTVQVQAQQHAQNLKKQGKNKLNAGLKKLKIKFK